jgi:hypothetical protein
MWCWMLSLAMAGPPSSGSPPIGGTVKPPTGVEIVPAVLEGSVRLVLPGREGDEVYVDGWPAGPLPVLTQLAEGPHQVKVDGVKGKVEVEVWVTVVKDKVPEIDLSAPPPPPDVTAPTPVPAPKK